MLSNMTSAASTFRSAQNSGMHAADATQLAEPAICYLQRVYPSLPQYRNARALHLLGSLRVLYAKAAAECNIGNSAGATKPLCRGNQTELVSVDERTFPNVFGGCNNRANCELRRSRYLPPWAAQLQEGHKSNNWIEVNRFAFAGKSFGARVPTQWREYLDGGLSGWWYYRAPGSGIFYRSGATLVAPTKQAMLVKLLHEWAANAALNTSEVLIETMRLCLNASWGGWSKFFIKGIAQRRPSHPVNAATSAEHFENRSVDGHRQGISDAWDNMLIRLGRALGYETLVFTTHADLQGAGRRHMSSTLVDLRYPFREELFNKRVDLVERGIWDSPSLVVPEGVATLDEDRARRWAQRVADSGILCFGSPPTRPGASPCSQPCNFTRQLSVRLACPGHISWALREESHPGCYKF